MKFATGAVLTGVSYGSSVKSYSSRSGSLWGLPGRSHVVVIQSSSSSRPSDSSLTSLWYCCSEPGFRLVSPSPLHIAQSPQITTIASCSYYTCFSSLLQGARDAPFCWNDGCIIRVRPYGKKNRPPPTANNIPSAHIRGGVTTQTQLLEQCTHGNVYIEPEHMHTNLPQALPRTLREPPPGLASSSRRVASSTPCGQRDTTRWTRLRWYLAYATR